jgi:hypothetical protein
LVECVTFAGVKGFLGNLDQMYDMTDEEGRQWEDFFMAWHARFRDKETTVSELTMALQGNDLFRDTLPDYLGEALEKSEGSFKKKLGRALVKRAGVCFANGLRLVRLDKDSHRNSLRWKVLQVGDLETCKGQQVDNTDNVIDLAGLRVCGFQKGQALLEIPHHPVSGRDK